MTFRWCANDRDRWLIDGDVTVSCVMNGRNLAGYPRRAPTTKVLQGRKIAALKSWASGTT